MAYSKLVKPESSELIHLSVLRTQRLSEHWMRVTLGGGEIEKFHPMGFDQWFRLFLPIGGDAGLDRVPAKANKICLLYTSPSPRDKRQSRMPSSA